MLRQTVKKRRGLSLRQQQALWAYAFLAIPLVFFVLIRIYPVFSAFNISVRKWNILSSDTPFVGFSNYAKLFADAAFIKVVGNTLYYVLLCVPSGLILALCIALMLNRIKRGVGFFRVLYFIPYVTSVVAVSWVWRWLFMKNRRHHQQRTPVRRPAGAALYGQHSPGHLCRSLQRGMAKPWLQGHHFPGRAQANSRGLL